MKTFEQGPLTATKIERLKPGPQRYAVPDGGCPGLQLRVTPKGEKSFRWQYKAQGKGTWLTIGRWTLHPAPGLVTLKEARLWVERSRVARAGGETEFKQLVRELEAATRPHAIEAARVDAAGPLMSDIVAAWWPVLDMRRKRKSDEVKGVWRVHLEGALGHLRMSQVTKAVCRDAITASARRAPVHAGKVLALLKQLLSYAESQFAEGPLKDWSSPVSNFKADDFAIENNHRERILSDRELPAFWRALDFGRKGERPNDAGPGRLAFKVLLLTGVRTQELRLARWTDLDLGAGLWTIPVQSQKLTLKEAKKAKPFVIPLSATTIEIFGELRTRAGKSPWVLASAESDDGHFKDKSLSRAMHRLFERAPDLAKMEPVTPHDLRRTLRTGLGRLGIPPHISERCLNHSLGRIVATYDQGDYLVERREALAKWDAHVVGLLASHASTAAASQ